MKKLLVLAAIVAALAIAACGGGSDGNNSATAATPATSGQTVSVKDVGNAGRVLVDSSGQALYASDQEAGGRVMCTGACVSFWTPLTIKGGDPHGSVPGKLGVITRPDGAQAGHLRWQARLLLLPGRARSGDRRRVHGRVRWPAVHLERRRRWRERWLLQCREQPEPPGQLLIADRPSARPASAQVDAGSAGGLPRHSLDRRAARPSIAEMSASL